MLSVRIFRSCVVGHECFFKCWAIELVSEMCIVSLLDRVVEVKPTYILLLSEIQSPRGHLNLYITLVFQFPLNTIKVIREFERIQKRICRHKMSIMFNEICRYIYIYIYIYMWGVNGCERVSLWAFVCLCERLCVFVSVCVCVCVCIRWCLSEIRVIMLVYLAVGC